VREKERGREREWEEGNEGERREEEGGRGREREREGREGERSLTVFFLVTAPLSALVELDVSLLSF
jgi:hypothetical protein